MNTSKMTVWTQIVLGFKGVIQLNVEKVKLEKEKNIIRKWTFALYNSLPNSLMSKQSDEEQYISVFQVNLSGGLNRISMSSFIYTIYAGLSPEKFRELKSKPFFQKCRKAVLPWSTIVKTLQYLTLMKRLKENTSFPSICYYM